MFNIKCDVTNCSHNNKGACHANIVNIGGKSAQKDSTTCCGSFLDSKLYGDLTNNINPNNTQYSSISCTVGTCHYNSDNQCTAKSIHVSGDNVNLYTETKCATFKTK